VIGRLEKARDYTDSANYHAAGKLWNAENQKAKQPTTATI